MTVSLAHQVRAFGVLGAYLNPKLLDLSALSPEALQRLGDPDVLRSMNASKMTSMMNTHGTEWALQRRLDLSDLQRFVQNRLRPCYPLFELADRNGDIPPASDHPMLYQTNDWPDNTPPAGHVRQAPNFTWNDLLKSYAAMWQLQLDRSNGPQMATVGAGNKLVRAALWIIKENGFLAAVEYLFSLLDHGFVIEPDAASWAFCRLYWVRRQVAQDSDLPAYLLQDADLGMAAWRFAEFKPTLPVPPVRELTDDIDLAIAKVGERERLARAAPDCDSWLLAYARLGLAARVTYQAMKITGLAAEFGYSSYAARFEEFHADVGAFFYAFPRDGATDLPGHALRPAWGMAASFARIAEQDGQEWLRHMLRERVVLPDALTPAFLEAPGSFSGVPAWQRPSHRLSRVLAQLVYREIPIERHRAVDGDPTTAGMVAGVFREAGHPGLADLADRASAIWPLIHRDATSGPPPHDEDGEILLNFLTYLLVQMPTEREEAKAWLDQHHLEWSNADLERSFEKVVAPGSPGDQEARLRRARSFVADYPFNGSARANLALREYEGGALAQAHGTVQEALILDPGTEHVWASASLICHAMGREEEGQIAYAMAKCLQVLQAG
ncbi:hypothetical protein [Roseomonas sp. BN140053]|uniref:hypothetical protein n=1 Tax=Roseomonas sp. BN140053 TaxID=3391898 RepID=UPI0039EA0475